MATQDDTSPTRPNLNQAVSADTARTRLQQAIDCERARLLQVSSVLHCLYEVLLYADGDDAVTYVEAVHLAANLIDESVEKLDIVRLGPMIEAIKGEKDRSGLGGPYEVREPRVISTRSASCPLPRNHGGADLRTFSHQRRVVCRCRCSPR